MPQSSTTPTASTERKPSGRQMYSIAYALLEIAGLEAPQNRADASKLIEQLSEQRAAVRAGSTVAEFWAMADLNYDGAPRPITPEEAWTIAHEEYALKSSNGQHLVLSRGADGGMHLRETFTRSQAAVVWMNVRRQDLRERILAGKCSHTVFYDRSRDRFWIG